MSSDIGVCGLLNQNDVGQHYRINSCHYYFMWTHWLIRNFICLQNSDAESLLLFGDDHGVIHLLYFSKPLTQLFDIPFNKEEGTTKIYFPVR